MKKFAAWSVLVLIALSLTACAGTSGGEHRTLKCPSCGYEIDIEEKG